MKANVGMDELNAVSRDDPRSRRPRPMSAVPPPVQEEVVHGAVEQGTVLTGRDEMPHRGLVQHEPVAQVDRHTLGMTWSSRMGIESG